MTLKLQPQAYSIQDTCTILGIGKTKLYEEINAGRIPAKKYGRKTLIPASSLDQWIAQLPDLPTPINDNHPSL